MAAASCAAHHGPRAQALVCGDPAPRSEVMTVDARASTSWLQRADCGWRVGTAVATQLLAADGCWLLHLVQHITDDKDKL